MAERKNQLFKKKRCLFSFHLIYFLALPYNTCTKWHERKSCHFKKLLSKWNSNYRNTSYTTNYQVSKCHFPSKKYNPYKIYQKRKHAISIHDFFSKRPECQGCKFKDIRTGKIEEIMLIKSPEDLEKFKEIYEITEEIAKEY